MSILFLSLLAGVMTILAPCVLPILPVILGGSVINEHKSRPWVIIVSFAISVLIYSLIIQRLVQSFGVRTETLTYISAGILLIFGITLLFPNMRQLLSHKISGDKLIQVTDGKQPGVRSDILLGVILGPVFNTCSPTYAILIATILPASFLWGLTNIIFYIIGLSFMLGLIAYGGRKIITKMKWASNPHGRFKKIIGILLILVAVALFFKRDKAAEAWIIEKGFFLDTTTREYNQAKQFK